MKRLLARSLRQLRLARALLEHAQTPRASKWLLAAALAYAATPIDLVPDWLPVVGHVDDFVVVGLLFWMAWRLVPADVVTECRAQIRIE